MVLVWHLAQVITRIHGLLTKILITKVVREDEKQNVFKRQNVCNNYISMLGDEYGFCIWRNDIKLFS